MRGHISAVKASCPGSIAFFDLSMSLEERPQGGKDLPLGFESQAPGTGTFLSPTDKTTGSSGGCGYCKPNASLLAEQRRVIRHKPGGFFFDMKNVPLVIRKEDCTMSQRDEFLMLKDHVGGS